jgi:AraC family transcriptional regulator, regulatory protein of adaptative response / DNA-3-methyladenine glycosylase II
MPSSRNGRRTGRPFPGTIDGPAVGVRFPPAGTVVRRDHDRVIEDFERCYRAVQSRDPRFDGWIYVGVATTGIYCRPSCPATTPKPANVRFYPTAAAAQAAGFRACRRCRPDATPGSPEWNVRADLVGRAMRLIADGVVDRQGVAGLARMLNYSDRQLHRQLVAEVGAGPVALARAQRAQTARVLIETTDMPLTDVAFAAGFASVRQFNDTIRTVFATTPTALRRAQRRRGDRAPGAIALRLPYRDPFDWDGVLAFLGARAVAGVEEVVDGSYRRTLRLAHGDGTVELRPGVRASYVHCTLRLRDLRDLASAVTRTRRLLDLDADPVAVADVLAADPLLAGEVARSPGRRSPGCVDGDELAARAVIGQQVSVIGARAVAYRLVLSCGSPLAAAQGGLTHTFPSSEAIVAADPTAFAMPESRREAIRVLARSLVGGQLTLDPGADRRAVERQLIALPGIGPWTAAYIAMRALGDPDAWMPTDLGVRKALERAGQPADPAGANRLAERWRPWRSYALHHLWASLDGPVVVPTADRPLSPHFERTA